MRNILLKGWRPALVLLFLFIIWEMVVKLAEIPAWLLPPPTEIIEEAMTGWSLFSVHLQSTIQLSLLGFVIGSSIGLITAIILHLIPIIRESIYPLLILSQNIPIIVLAPLLVIWFGFGLMPKLIVITLVCFFPITVAALDGFRQTPNELKHYMMMAGANRGQLFWKLELPYSLPAVFSGLKISATYSVMGAVISEWLGAKNGVGVYMTLASSSFRTDRVFVAILFIMIVSLILFAIILLIERILVRWKAKEENKK
ncbi:ABC-type nitrate/sulfonate/bicarbonate transport system permease component [Cytobacillus eiseniae]|uniref:ABC-type nitrate/sulfonate/bicarbonate transport system permease component n=1 Tax=Cytobacillus eiseniae TaxID=762947 RepID=A0ABS4RIP9_9BACI|nr:ABC transporter permease [Cytobacillus eiseniae]MBP2242785.1 ABC-type nitrate/sulfonate/bicarbonate transport system permease component [Cytobacillus eiseniae]